MPSREPIRATLNARQVTTDQPQVSLRDAVLEENGSSATSASPVPIFGLALGVAARRRTGVSIRRQSHQHHLYPIYGLDGRARRVRSGGQPGVLVTEAVKERLSRPDAAEGLRPATSPGEAALLDARMAVVRQRLDQAAELFNAGHIDARQYALNTRRLRADLEALGTKLAALARRDALVGSLSHPDPKIKIHYVTQRLSQADDRSA